jgi:two-component system KDP operon response regulator KdpE
MKPRGLKGPGDSSLPRRILLKDDDPVVRGTVSSLLHAAGHHVEEADGGAAGIACLAETPLDVVLTDLGIPEWLAGTWRGP